MVAILMEHNGHTLQSAVDYVGDLCTQTIAGFERDCDQLPSWGPEIDGMVQKYVECLKSWIVGSLHWSFQTHRYFGTNGDEVKKTGLIPLFPPEA
ncbi:Alpha-muurolene synthase [Termitomyces sp. T32_za158]|nr:Alpha-muurolene synthase [Termitomyces sp. T32_za158]